MAMRQFFTIARRIKTCSPRLAYMKHMAAGEGL